jgi:hypothetical protein
MEERIRFVKNCRSGLYEMSELCDRYVARSAQAEGRLAGGE